MPVKNLRDGTIKVQVDNDGGGNPGEVIVTLEEGNLSWTESRPVSMISDRGTLDHARRTVQDQLVELTFSVMYQDHTDPNSASPTLYEACTRQGAASAWVSQNSGDSDDYSVNLEFTVTDPAGGTAEVINFDLLNFVSEDFAEGDPNTLTFTGTAPLYWVDFWWTPEDSINPRIGGDCGTFTRAGTATYWDENGIVQYARSGEFRSNHHPNAGGRTGLLEAQRTNLATMSEDLGGTDWTATNITVGDDDNVGPDGYTTAETLTASAGNGTLIQDLGVIASAAKTFSIWLKRKTGTGDIDITLNGGGAWTTVTVTSSWARFELTATLADPDVGIRIVTNADAVYAWGAQLEDSAPFGSSYIPTTVYPLSPDGYLEFSGAAGNYASTPDAAVLDIVGDIDLRARIASDDYTPTSAEAILGKWTTAGNQRSYLFRLEDTGELALLWSTDGTALTTAESSIPTGLTNGSTHWVRATLDVSSGNVNFYTSDDGENWTLLGAADQGAAGATSIFAGTALLELGSATGGTAQNLAGKIYRAQVYDGIAGTLVFDADPQDTSTHGVTRVTLTEKENSAVVTTFATSSSATRVKDSLVFPLPKALETPGNLTAYADIHNYMLANVGVFPVVFNIGDFTAGSGSSAAVFVNGTGDVWTFRTDTDAGGTVSTSIGVGNAPTVGNDFEFHVPIPSSGDITWGVSKDGGTEGTTPHTPGAWGAVWNQNTITLGAAGDGSAAGIMGFREFIMVRRTRTLSDLRKMG